MPPGARASSTQRWVRDAALLVDHRADIRLRIQRIAELQRLRALGMNFAMNASQTSSWTNIRWTQMQTWPA